MSVAPSAKKRRIDDSDSGGSGLISITTAGQTPTSSPPSETPTTTTTTTTTTTPEPQPQPQLESTSLPRSLTDLTTLNSSFVKALILHFAHNGPLAPADLRDFLHGIQRIWKKRKVTIQDLRRLVWVWDQRGLVPGCACASSRVPLFRIVNYGLGRVCLECVNRSGSGSGVGSAGAGCTVDENELRVEFERVLGVLWVRWNGDRGLDRDLDKSEDVDEDNEEEEEDEEDGLSMLGLAQVHEELTPLTTNRTGQLRLQDLKGGIIKTKTDALRAKTNEDGEDSKSKSADTPTDRRKGLLDRIKDKKLQQSKLPPPPSKEMLLRRAAAERVEDVVSVVALLRPTTTANASVGASSSPSSSLTTVTQRKPFRLETIVQHVQDSVRNPISFEEVEICLDILARIDVAGQWVSFVTVKGIRSVVLKSFGNVSPPEIGRRVRQMRIGWEG